MLFLSYICFSWWLVWDSRKLLFMFVSREFDRVVEGQIKGRTSIAVRAFDHSVTVTRRFQQSGLRMSLTSRLRLLECWVRMVFPSPFFFLVFVWVLRISFSNGMLGLIVVCFPSAVVVCFLIEAYLFVFFHSVSRISLFQCNFPILVSFLFRYPVLVSYHFGLLLCARGRAFAPCLSAFFYVISVIRGPCTCASPSGATMKFS